MDGMDVYLYYSNSTISLRTAELIPTISFKLLGFLDNNDQSFLMTLMIAMEMTKLMERMMIIMINSNHYYPSALPQVTRARRTKRTRTFKLLDCDARGENAAYRMHNTWSEETPCRSRRVSIKLGPAWPQGTMAMVRVARISKARCMAVQTLSSPIHWLLCF